LLLGLVALAPRLEDHAVALCINYYLRAVSGNNEAVAALGQRAVAAKALVLVVVHALLRQKLGNDLRVRAPFAPSAAHPFVEHNAHGFRAVRKGVGSVADKSFDCVERLVVAHVVPDELVRCNLRKRVELDRLVRAPRLVGH
jgi:hypothetical protein